MARDFRDVMVSGEGQWAILASSLLNLEALHKHEDLHANRLEKNKRVDLSLLDSL